VAYNGLVNLFCSHALVLMLVLRIGLVEAQSVEPSQFQLDKEDLGQVEDLSESLANALIDFSSAVQQREPKRIVRFFHDPVQATPWPASLGPSTKTIKWISLGVLQPVPSATLMREQLENTWEAFLSLFSEIEDARFKVKQARFSGEPERGIGKSGFKFFLVGRDQSNRRLWVRGDGRIEAERTGTESWLISVFRIERIQTLRTDVDLFSQVALPAGVSVSLPAYGSPGNNDFVYHGAAAGDVDGDGLIDVFATGIGRNYLYRNQGSTFSDAAEDAGVAVTLSGTAPLFLDADNDGDLDLFVAAVGEQMFFENRLIPDGKLSFRDISQEAGVSLPAVGFSATAADVNRDGWTDIYVTSYNRYGRVMPNSWHRASNGTPNLLFLNQKDGTFTESAKAWGVQDRRWSYAAQFADIDGNGLLDLYVANDFGENALYVNLGDRFQDRADSSGVLDPGNGMGVSFGDYNNDGHLDLYVTNMSSTAGNRILDRLFPSGTSSRSVLRKLAAGNSLFQGNSKGDFRDVSASLGPFGAGWAWGGVFVDFDNDGWEDLYSPNGFISGKSMKDT